MSAWAAKRFWTDVTVGSDGDGHIILLDARPVKSPGKRPLQMPSRAMADAVAAEWRAVVDVIDPATMPMTRSVNSAVDQVAPQRGAVIDMLASYAETDLLCHRADSPADLVTQQNTAWDPLLEWAAHRYHAPLVVAAGVLPQDQPSESLEALHGAVALHSDFALTGLHDLIAISGSIVVGLAVATGEISVEDGWMVSRIDERWQIAQWGEDDEANARAADQRAAFGHAKRFLDLSNPD